MRNQFFLRHSILWLAFLAVFGACSGKTKVESDLGVRGAPDWVNEGTQVLNDRDGRLFHGVGFAQEMGNESLQISTANERARAEVARILTSYMDVVSRDFATSASSDDERLTEQQVSRQIHNFTKVNLSGAKVLGHWKDKRNGNIWSAAELDMKHIKSTLQAVDQMNDDLKRYIDDNGDNIFDRVAKERR
jgi:hypothetical protein